MTEFLVFSDDVATEIDPTEPVVGVSGAQYQEIVTGGQPRAGQTQAERVVIQVKDTETGKKIEI